MPTALVIREFMLECGHIPMISMYPTFNIGDCVLVEKISKRIKSYQRGDVILFRPPEVAMARFQSMIPKNALFVKRVVAIGGDKVMIKDGILYVNGLKQREDFIAARPNYNLGVRVKRLGWAFLGRRLEPVVVPKGHLLVLGDNRNLSVDGHIWGFLSEKNVIGRAFFKCWPPNRIGLIEGLWQGEKNDVLRASKR